MHWLQWAHSVSFQFAVRRFLRWAAHESPSDSLRAIGPQKQETGRGLKEPASQRFFRGGKYRGDIRTFKNRICFVLCACKPLFYPRAGQKLANAAAWPGFESRLSNFLPLFFFGESRLFPLVS
jgi:hypothetical protein